MGLGDSCFVRFKDHLGTVIVDVERSEDQDKSREGLRSRQPNTNYLHREESKGALTKNLQKTTIIVKQLQPWCETHCVGRDGLQPVIIKVEQHHLWFCSLQDQVSKLLHFKTGLEGQLQLRAFDHNVGEVEQVDLHRENNASQTGKVLQSGFTFEILH